MECKDCEHCDYVECKDCDYYAECFNDRKEVYEQDGNMEEWKREILDEEAMKEEIIKQECD